MLDDERKVTSNSDGPSAREASRPSMSHGIWRRKRNLQVRSKKKLQLLFLWMKFFSTHTSARQNWICSSICGTFFCSSFEICFDWKILLMLITSSWWLMHEKEIWMWLCQWKFRLWTFFFWWQLDVDGSFKNILGFLKIKINRGGFNSNFILVDLILRLR